MTKFLFRIYFINYRSKLLDFYEQKMKTVILNNFRLKFHVYLFAKEKKFMFVMFHMCLTSKFSKRHILKQKAWFEKDIYIYVCVHVFFFYS